MDVRRHDNPGAAADRPSRPIRKEDRRLTGRARELRKQAPVCERMLWGLLCDRRLGGLKFRRQVPIGRFIADYYCAECSLIVELDGPSHDGRLQQDLERQAYLESRGLRIVRVTNDDVIADVMWVGEQILRVASTMDKPSGEATPQDVRPSPQPSPQRGEGVGAQACP